MFSWKASKGALKASKHLRANEYTNVYRLKYFFVAKNLQQDLSEPWIMLYRTKRHFIELPLASHDEQLLKRVVEYLVESGIGVRDENPIDTKKIFNALGAIESGHDGNSLISDYVVTKSKEFNSAKTLKELKKLVQKKIELLDFKPKKTTKSKQTTKPKKTVKPKRGNKKLLKTQIVPKQQK